ncbi:MAG TPA: glycosyltransferase [Alphaproteobacteria bacterium]|jgi:glycosyltransferase involved in cell wall biosynthesis|nr:glycosyltransferase [Alphaproteobacteria bacterium]
MQKKSITIAIPVYNEEIDLPKNIPILYSFLKQSMDSYDWKIVIVDNASIDKTSEVGRKLAQQKNINYIKLEKKGRGLALRECWNNSDDDYLAYMDIDLSSDIKFFPKLISALDSGAGIAIGSRLITGSKVYGRPILREIMSRGYSLLFRTFFGTSFSDAQCGFKAITKSSWTKLEPLVDDKEWFFDSELLIIADKAKFRIAEIPIVWTDDPASTVKVAKTAWGDIKGLFRLFKEQPWKNLQ